jgi:hypothetical protein
VSLTLYLPILLLYESKIDIAISRRPVFSRKPYNLRPLLIVILHAYPGVCSLQWCAFSDFLEEVTGLINHEFVVLIGLPRSLKFVHSLMIAIERERVGNIL